MWQVPETRKNPAMAIAIPGFCPYVRLIPAMAIAIREFSENQRTGRDLRKPINGKTPRWQLPSQGFVHMSD
jgi:hypothetical protein